MSDIHGYFFEDLKVGMTASFGRTVTEAELVDHVAARLAAYKVPAHITLTDQRLPRSPTGKVLKRQLRAEG